MADIKVEGDVFYTFLDHPDWIVPNVGEKIYIEPKFYFIEDKYFDLKQKFMVLKVKDVY